MNRQETFDLVCVVLEEYQVAEVEEIAGEILKTLALEGEDLLAHLDPPPGLQTWLRSHGFSLVATSEAVSPRVWEILEAEEIAEDPEEREGDDSFLQVQVGDYVEYQTAPAGPQHVSTLGSGWVEHVEPDGVWVRHEASDRPEYLDPQAGDVIRLLRPAPTAQTAEAPPW